jgi:hypothetical protein
VLSHSVATNGAMNKNGVPHFRGARHLDVDETSSAIAVSPTREASADYPRRRRAMPKAAAPRHAIAPVAGSGTNVRTLSMYTVTGASFDLLR